MKDLISGDSAKALLKNTQLVLVETEKKVKLKDSIILVYQTKEENYNKIIESEREKFNIQKNYSDKLEVQLNKQNKKNTWVTIIANALAIIAVIITK